MTNRKKHGGTLVRAAGEKVDPSESAKFAITHFSTWIGNADNKASLLVAATTLLGGGAASQRDVVRQTIRAGGTVNTVAITVFCLAISALVGSAFFLVSSLLPRAGSSEPSRYAWPHVANLSDTDLSRLDQDQEKTEAWATAHALARIAGKKYRSVRRAIWCWLVAALALACWVVLAP